MKSNAELEAELVEVRQAIRDSYALISRFKPGSFERTPMPALQKILAGEVSYELPAAESKRELPGPTGVEQVRTGG